MQGTIPRSRLAPENQCISMHMPNTSLPFCFFSQMLTIDLTASYYYINLSVPMLKRKESAPPNNEKDGVAFRLISQRLYYIVTPTASHYNNRYVFALKQCSQSQRFIANSGPCRKTITSAFLKVQGKPIQYKGSTAGFQSVSQGSIPYMGTFCSRSHQQGFSEAHIPKEQLHGPQCFGSCVCGWLAGALALAAQ